MKVMVKTDVFTLCVECVDVFTARLVQLALDEALKKPVAVSVPDVIPTADHLNVVEMKERNTGPDERIQAKGDAVDSPKAVVKKDGGSYQRKGSFNWTWRRDNIVRANFDVLGPSGIYDKSLLPGFTLHDIRKRCQVLGLMDQYGNRVEKHDRRDHE